MNTIFTTPDVKLFVTAVREHLTDLTEEEREELVGGLEGDMSDLVAERGVEALPEPSEYAAELRAAAGFTPVARPRRSARDLRGRTTARLDRGAATWARWVETRDHLGVPAFAQSVRPVWWVVRALCAAVLVVEMTGTYIYGFTLNRALLALVAIVLSVQLGRGAWGTGALLRRSLAFRLLLIALNVLAVALVPLMLNRFMVAQTWAYEAEPVYDASSDGLTFHGSPVRNVYAYDAQGRPVTGVQLVDQDGRRLMVSRDQYDPSTGTQIRLTPWQNGRTELYSVFPLQEQATDEYSGEPVGDARVPAPPFASLPPVTLAGVQPSVLLTPAQVEAQRRAAERKAAQAARLDSKKPRGR